jgi:hypothetical protein
MYENTYVLIHLVKTNKQITEQQKKQFSTIQFVVDLLLLLASIVAGVVVVVEAVAVVVLTVATVAVTQVTICN